MTHPHAADLRKQQQQKKTHRFSKKEEVQMSTLWMKTRTLEEVGVSDIYSYSKY